MQKEIGKPVDPFLQEITSLFQEVEGINALYYGKVRNGKTRCATEDIIDLLERGEVVYANWPISFEGFDQRQSPFTVAVKAIAGKKYFFKYTKNNFNYFHPDDIDISFLGRLVGVHLFIDEGQWIFNSHDRNADPEKRKLILHGGHYCRSLNVITQRPINVFKDIRSQINVWYKCEKLLSSPFLLFRRSTITEMKDDLPDEEQVDEIKIYWPWNNKKVFSAYNTHAMRAKDAVPVMPEYEAFEVTKWDAVRLLLSAFLPVPKSPRKRRVTPRAGAQKGARVKPQLTITRSKPPVDMMRPLT